jgi:hypothetical protein
MVPLGSLPCAFALPRLRDFRFPPRVHLVFLHGAPATGKYTVGRELAALTGFEFYHNHLVVDDVLKRHAFGTPGFIAERDRAWREHLDRAFTRLPPGLIFTFNPENSVPQEFIDWLFAAAPARGAALHSVELTASHEEILARLGSEQRRQFGKLTDPLLFERLTAEGVFLAPRIPRTDLRLDSGTTSAPDAARRIVAHFRL